MANLLNDDVDGAVYSGSDHNANNTLIENSFTDLGPLIISGLAVTIGTGLSVNVALGVAVIGGRVTKSGSFTISGLTDATTNYLYLLQDGTTDHNTTGLAPSNSVLLGTCATAAGAVSSVDTNRSSGRQLKVRTEALVPGGPGAGNPASISLAAWGAAAANGVTVYGTLPADALPTTFTAPLTFTADDASGSAITEVLTLRHSNSGGAGAAGIGAGLELQVETATGGTFNAAARVESAASVVTAGAVTGDLRLRVSDAGTFVTPLLVETKKLSIAQAPNAGANYGLLNIGNQGFSGGGGTAFVGSASGTGLAINLAGGNLIDGQLAGVSKFLVTSAGNTTVNALTVNADSSLADGVDFALGTSTGSMFGTGTTQKLAFYGSTPLAQQGSTTDLRSALINLGFIATGGASPLNLNGGAFAAGGAVFSGQLGGSGRGLSFVSASVTPGSDADVTLASNEYSAYIVSLSTGAWASGHNVIVPNDSGAMWLFTNNTTFTATVKTAAGAGIAVATGKAAILRCNGTDVKRVTADV